MEQFPSDVARKRSHDLHRRGLQGQIVLSMTLLSMTETAPVTSATSASVLEATNVERVAPAADFTASRNVQADLRSFRFGARSADKPEEPDSQPRRSNRVKTVALLEIFVVEIFVLNRSEGLCTLQLRTSGRGTGKQAVGLLPLDNDVQVGPLLPEECQSVRLRYIAMGSGLQSLGEILLIDADTGQRDILSDAMHVLVQ